MIRNDIIQPSGARFRLTRVRASHTARVDELVACDTSAGAMTVTLPTAPSSGACVAVGDDADAAHSGAITVVGGDGTELIDGEASYTIDYDGGREVFVFDGSEWRRVIAEREIPDTRLGATRRVRAYRDFHVPSSSGGWTTILDLDFAAQPSKSLAANGAQVIGGYNFQRENAASDRVAMQLVNGQGVVMTPAVSAYGLPGPARTAPLLWLPLTELGLPDAFSLEGGLRIWTRLTYARTFDPFSTGERAVVGLDNGPAFTWSRRVWFDFSASSTDPTAGAGFKYNAANGENTTGAPDVNLANNRSFACVLPELVDGIERTVFQGGAAKWPNQQSGLTPRVSHQTSYGTARDIQVIGSINALGIVLAGACSVLGSEPVYTFSALRVDYRLG